MLQCNGSYGKFSLYILIMSRTRFRVNPDSIFTWMSRNSLLKTGAKSEVFKWLQLDSNPQPLSSQTNTQPFGQTSPKRICSWVTVLIILTLFSSINDTFAFLFHVICVNMPMTTPCAEEYPLPCPTSKMERFVEMCLWCVCA